MTCGKELLTQAYFDGELEAARVLEIEDHLSSCPDCKARMEEDTRLRGALREAAPYYRAPGRLQRKVERGGKRPASGSLFERLFKWTVAPGSLALGTVGGAALMLAVVFSGVTPFAPSGADLVIEDVATAHMRSLLAGHLIDVASTDRHTVKPWFNGRVDVSPPVGNFTSQGFKLVGGRLDYVGRRIVAVTVYQRGKHVINLFSWPDLNRKLPGSVSRAGYNLLTWRQDNIVFCAISDVSRDDLARLSTLIKTAMRSQGRE